MRYLGVIPARGGSKGIPLKNIRKINGKPLIMYTVEAINKIKFDGDVVVSTDSELIMQTVKKESRIEIVHRPKEISGDYATTEEALIHAISVMEKKNGYKYDAIITLQVTSPLRRPETIMACMQKYEQEREEHDALLTLTENRDDYWIKNGLESYIRLYPDAPRRRQSREPLYVENGVVYITDRDALLETKSVLGRRPNGIIVSKDESIDINDEIDMLVAEQLLREEHIK